MNTIVCIQQIANGVMILFNNRRTLFETKDAAIGYLNMIFDLEESNRITNLPNTLVMIEAVDNVYKLTYSGLRISSSLTNL